ncbi:mitochondrial hypoxia responsive domain-containing protein [Lindgomyces ingoldianus]|uniref:Mitochondrial hypoxia responsive domain-containing protein n=1 Tax=Lindgomyces ingoldianus TaxID=673940 RepID=A0ACB6RCF6_9PLEO|nr:mitochondrial hypoxia responsive domain-containing protein [Lindgomyces ingoldianus]KAF2476730.1 mitochondrial hypoxia responsive domain-containing protein [Lindgomyces ingoldianus]
MNPNSAPLPSSFDEDTEFYDESRAGKIWRRFREEPLIPLGCGLTVWAIVGATRSMKRGNHKMTNLYFRRRLYAQAFTIAVLVAGNMYWQKDRVKRKEYEKLVAEKERMEKRERWLKELEARDEEDKVFKARLARRMRAAEGAEGAEGAGGAEGELKGVTEMVKEKTREMKEKVVGDGK